MCAVIIALIIHQLFLLVCEYLFYTSEVFLEQACAVCPQHGKQWQTHNSKTLAVKDKTMSQGLPTSINQLLTRALTCEQAALWSLAGINTRMRMQDSLKGSFHCVGLTDHWTAQKTSREHRCSNPCPQQWQVTFRTLRK